MIEPDASSAQEYDSMEETVLLSFVMMLSRETVLR